ncbi:Galactose oxidase [Mycena venus]|uniref:Galactose oxidase n=1 Tax=Mycena venus TaxID=2733690 RepID=A0A8H6XBL6_9AGAR|nr:Galactose oxidase [Mycena venus]
MAKKKSGNSAAAKAAKKAKASQKVERTAKKKVGKQKKMEDDEGSDDDLEGILEKLRVEWEEAHKVTEELADGPPSRRANATLTAEDGKAYFYSDVYRYSPEKAGRMAEIHFSNLSWSALCARRCSISGWRWKNIPFRFGGFPLPFCPTAKCGYCKEYIKGKRPVGVMLEDTWFLKMTLNTNTGDSAPAKPSSDPLVVKWERRKRPLNCVRSCAPVGTMTLWTAKNTGILFGGVTDEDTGEETLESVFWNDLNGYQVAGKGKWVSMTLKRPKSKGKPKKKNQVPVYKPEDHADSDNDDGDETENTAAAQQLPVVEVDPDDPLLTTPLPRYNAMLAVLRNTLYIYGGIYEKGKREYTLDDFYSIQLDKLERYTCLKESGIVIADEDDDSSSEDDDDDEDDEDEDEEEEDEENQDDIKNPPVADDPEPEEVAPDIVEPTADEQVALRLKATAFMGVSKEKSPEELLSTPPARRNPRHVLCSFPNGKQLRRDGFALAEETYETYKPILKEVEKILAEAGLDEEEMRQRAAGGGVRAEQSRNRR